MPLCFRLKTLLCSAMTALACQPQAHAAVWGSYHVLPLPGYFEKTGRLPPGGGDGPLYYYGGSVFSNVKVVSVIWNRDVFRKTKGQVPAFSAALVNGTYLDQMVEYSTLHQKAVNGHRSTKQVVGRGSYLGQVQLRPRNTSKQLTDADIQKELKGQIRRGVLPPHDGNTLYMIYFPPDITILLDGLTSCTHFGAYHFATNDTRPARRSNIFYTVEPECNAGFDYLTYAASHEFAEALTDNVPTPGNVPDFPQAWNNASGYETADLCPIQGLLTDGTHSWTVSQIYLNSIGSCGSGNYQSP